VLPCSLVDRTERKIWKRYMVLSSLTKQTYEDPRQLNAKEDHTYGTKVCTFPDYSRSKGIHITACSVLYSIQTGTGTKADHG
jgi:hypothetical protein